MAPETNHNIDTARAYTVVRYSHMNARAELERLRMGQFEIKSACGALPDRFPIVVRTSDFTPVEPVLRFLLEQHLAPVPDGWAPRTLNSALAAAYDITAFLEHLDVKGHTWDEPVDQALLDSFVADQTAGVSERTGRRLAASTIHRRLESVDAFCRSRAFERLGRATFAKDDAPTAGFAANGSIHPLSVEDWRALAPHLGPRPSQAGSDVSCAPRLAAEWALLAGLRSCEVAGLAINQVDGYDLPSSPDAVLPVQITRTKGGRPRTILAPAVLLQESRAYIRGERASAGGDVLGGDALILNPPGGRRAAGRPTSSATIRGWYHDAVVAAGLVRRHVDPSRRSGTVARHTFHDLRHTYAVWTYAALHEAGVAQPLKIVQARLGHRRLATTTDIYLAFIENDEETIADAIRVNLRRWQ